MFLSHTLTFVTPSTAAMEQARFQSGGYCDVCKMAVRYVDGILEQNATEAQITDAVRKVCSFLPESVRSEVRRRRKGWWGCVGV